MFSVATSDVGRCNEHSLCLRNHLLLITPRLVDELQESRQGSQEVISFSQTLMCDKNKSEARRVIVLAAGKNDISASADCM